MGREGEGERSREKPKKKVSTRADEGGNVGDRVMESVESVEAVEAEEGEHRHNNTTGVCGTKRGEEWANQHHLTEESTCCPCSLSFPFPLSLFFFFSHARTPPHTFAFSHLPALQHTRLDALGFCPESLLPSLLLAAAPPTLQSYGPPGCPSDLCITTPTPPSPPSAQEPLPPSSLTSLTSPPCATRLCDRYLATPRIITSNKHGNLSSCTGFHGGSTYLLGLLYRECSKPGPGGWTAIDHHSS